MKITIPASTNVEIIRYENETYFKLGTSNRTSSGGTDQNFFLTSSEVKDASITRYTTGTTPITVQFAYATELHLDAVKTLARYDGAIYYRPVGGTPC